MNNRKIIFVLLALVFLLWDLALSGKYEFSKLFLFFPVPFFLLSVKFPLEELLVPGLLYGFLFDISSLTKIPVMACYILAVMALSWFLRGRFVDISQSLNLMFFSIIVEIVLFFAVTISTGNLIYTSTIFILLFYDILASAAVFIVSQFLMDKVLGSGFNEKN
jgi:hypothetical protein